MDAAHSTRLDVIRWLAAFAVLAGHVRGLFFVEFGRVESPGVVQRATYLLTGYGHQAVMIFFVLSGFLVGGTVLRALGENRFRWRSYLTRRLTRLAIVLIPALLLTAFWDHLGTWLFGASGVYDGIPGDKAILYYAARERATFPIFLGNALFTQEILVPPYGSNGPLWSLSYELWYYVLFPFLALAWTRGRKPMVRAGYAIAASGVVAFVGARITAYFAVWLLGVGVMLLPRAWGARRATSRRVAMAVAGVAFAAALLVARTLGDRVGDVADALVGVTFAGVLYTLLLSPASATAPARPSIWTKLAAFSYTLYVVHVPVLVLIKAWMLARGGARWQPDAMHLAMGVALLAGVVVYAWLVSLVTEERTDALRKRVMALFDQRMRAENSSIIRPSP